MNSSKFTLIKTCYQFLLYAYAHILTHTCIGSQSSSSSVDIFPQYFMQYSTTLPPFACMERKKNRCILHCWIELVVEHYTGYGTPN